MWIENFNALKEQNRIPIFECGSPKLAKHITEKIGMVPIYSYKHSKTNRLIQVFIKTRELEEILVEWHANNPRKVNE